MARIRVDVKHERDGYRGIARRDGKVVAESHLHDDKYAAYDATAALVRGGIETGTIAEQRSKKRGRRKK